MSRPGFSRPGKRKQSDPEHALQRAVWEWAQLARRTTLPELEALFAIDCAGIRHINYARALKSRGVVAGIPDLCLPVARHGYHSLWIELKSLTGTLSSSQREWRDRLEVYGHRYMVCRTLEGVIDVVTRYLRGDPGTGPAAACPPHSEPA